MNGARPAVHSEELVPSWLRRLAAIGWRVLATIALAGVVVWLAVELSTVTAAILIALIVGATFAPYVRGLRRRGWSRTRSAAAVSLAALGVLAATLTLLLFAFVPYIADVLTGIAAGGDTISEWLTASGAPDAVITLFAFVSAHIGDIVTTLAANLVGPIAGFVTALILGGFLTFYLLADGDRAWAWLVAPIHGWRADAITGSGRVGLDRVGGYLRGTAIIAATDALTDFVYLTLLGVPLAAPLAILVLVAGFVPYLGGFVATTILALVTLATNGSTDVLILLVLIGITNLVQTNVLAPMIYGKSLDVHPALVLIALPAGAALFGVMGLFAALPVVAFSRAIAPSVILALHRAPDDDGSLDGSLVPIWLERLGQASWRGLVAFGLLAVVVAIAAQAPVVIVPVTLAVILASTLGPATAALRERGRSRGIAAALVTAGTTFVVLGIVVITLVTLVGPLREILATAEDGAREGVLGSIGLGTLVGVFSAGLLNEVAAILRGIAGLGIVLLLATLLTFYFLRDGPLAWRRIVGRLAEPRRTEVSDAGARASGVLGGYMIGTAAISLFGAATTAILMLILGLPLAIPIAVLAFFLGFIPYIGGFVSTILAFLVTVSVGEPSDIVVMGVFTIVFNIAQGNFVTPLVYGRAVSLHPAVVLLAIPAGNQLAGIAGMFLIVPLLGIVAATWRSALRVVDTDEALAQLAPPDAAVTDPTGEGMMSVSESTLGSSS